MIQLYFITPLQQDGHMVASVIAENCTYDDTSATLHCIRRYATDEGREIDVDGQHMTVFKHNIAAILTTAQAKE